MSPSARPRAKRAPLAASLGLVAALPTAAFFLAPALAAAPSQPESGLAGFNTTATAIPIAVQPLTPGIAGAGNLTLGNLVEVAIPYATTSTSGGPQTSSLAAPIYPGDTAADLGGALSTLSSQIPSSLANALNDHVLASSSYPPDPVNGIGTSSTYAPPGVGSLGVGTASARSSAGSSSATGTLSDTSLGALIEIASAKATTTATVATSSVSTESQATIGGISLLGGLVKIQSIFSDAVASSNGTGSQSSKLEVGGVTVAGLPAYIGPDGIQLAKTTGLLGGVVSAANQALSALRQVGLQLSTLAPSVSVQGGQATVTAGALQIDFLDTNIPNPNGQLPLLPRSVGLDIDLGLSQASAAGSRFPSLSLPTTPVPTSPSTPTSPSVTPVSTTSTYTGGKTVTVTITNSSASSGQGSTANGGATIGGGSAGSAPPSSLSATPASFMGLPVRVAWTVLGFVLAVIASGPLLAYANWQLLRGRRT
jgi:hypothetical protein